ncbi:CPBP family intramembrane glutamic endopeptidase [Maritimibacter fusiformis]|uniref:CPBP family intramembrane metalloprotease n=1 Tax=Maritimibacter fusiformis TaxID=2603819 RepID=A0A5D0RNF9_9RHOB|nr:CPBP family intramembrane glutamic endopeptidase [Maritimibacter fusiformis]TYB82496.1 CPBP family intramembrane metalloprotease [Maritimibacter fusiformis]
MPTRHIALFLLVTFGWSWGFWSIPMLDHRGVHLSDTLIRLTRGGTPAAWGPLVGALVVASVRGGFSGVWSLARRAGRLRIGWRWYAVVFLTFPVLVGGSAVIASLAGVPAFGGEVWTQPIAIPVAFFYILLLGGPLQEEFGWRGTLLDPLQDRLGGLGASLAVGAVWSLWHVPLFLFPNDAAPYYGKPFWGLLVTLMSISVLFTWVWNRTGRSITAVLVLHAMFNLSHWLFPALESDLAGLILFGAQFLAVGLVIARDGVSLGRRGEP